MKTFCVAGLLLLGAFTAAFADKPVVPRYIGEWSDGRGQVLVVTASKFRLGSHASSFKEVFRSKDERFFRFDITSGGGGFDGRYISIEVGREEMQMREYRSQADRLNDKQVAGVIAWSRDR